MVSPALPMAPSRQPIKRKFMKLALVTGVVLVGALVMGLVWWTRSPVLLADGNQLAKSQLFEHWQAGEIAVLVRHAERCDQSTNPCLGPADGITQVGSMASTDVGHGFNGLGMERADVFSSPATRTLQTAQYMFGKEAAKQDWLVECGKTMRDDVVAHKTAHRNLVLVTHSGCISDFEAQTGFKHAATSQYTSALFVSITAEGQLKVLGTINSADWSTVLRQRVATQ
ncbi:histidine phosphatase family protein [Pseudomonas sp. ok272]|uniref:lipopolysaccharide core heptose(II)-phosphate phosphatase PmrG n=1 Tax=unclassified Pseudomonas TaxID=196821 RepID=UPI003532177E